MPGTSTQDRNGCPDTDGDGYSDPDAGWGAGDGADAFPSDNSIWADADGDGVDDISDDGCPNVWGDSLNDRLGCPDMDGDGYSDPDSSWTVAMVLMYSLTTLHNGLIPILMATAMTQLAI